MYIPVSVLIAICKAVDSDPHAYFKTAKLRIFISRAFRDEFGVAIRIIEDKELRKWAENEFQIRHEKSNHDIDNKGLQERHEMDTARIAGLLDEIKELENQNSELRRKANGR